VPKALSIEGPAATPIRCSHRGVQGRAAPGIGLKPWIVSPLDADAEGKM
jgi:hypothetical protein